MVYNNCTDSGLAGVQVILQTFKDDKNLIQQREIVSSNNGSFVFENAEIHSSDKYNYALHIPSKSGIGAQEKEHCGFNGTTMYFFKHDTGLFFKPRVRPSFLFMRSYFVNSNVTTENDSVIIKYTQNEFHQNDPSLPHYFFSGSTGNIPSGTSTMGNYPMGMYQIEIRTIRNGQSTIRHDSIYIGWADTKTYTINW